MPRPRSVELVVRDQQVLEMAAAGYTQRDIASTLGISAARVNQILKRDWQTFEDDADRSFQKEVLDSAIKVSVGYMLGPGEQRVAANGKPVYEPLVDEEGNPVYRNGQLVPDTSKPVRDEQSKVKAAETVGRLIATRARVFGTERKTVPIIEESSEVTEMIEWLEQGVAENARLRQLLASNGIGTEVIEAEVISESES